MANTVFVGTRPENQRRGVLAPVVQGSTESVHTITVKYTNGDAYDLTGMTLSGAWWLSRDNTTVYPITGTLTVTDAAAGVFTWDKSAADVGTADVLRVQFIITNASDLEIDATFAAAMTVEPRTGAESVTLTNVIDGGNAVTVPLATLDGGDATAVAADTLDGGNAEGE